MSRIPEYRRLAALGLSKAEAARRCSVHPSAVARAAQRHGIRFVAGVGKPGPEIWTPQRRARQAEAIRAWHREQRA